MVRVMLRPAISSSNVRASMLPIYNVFRQLCVRDNVIVLIISYYLIDTFCNFPHP